MNEDGPDNFVRVLKLPSDTLAEIRFERAGDKVQVSSSVKSPQSSSKSGFWWHRCSEHGCLGEAVVQGRPCIRHLDYAPRTVYLAEVHKSPRLSLRGVQVSQALWDEIRQSPAFVAGVSSAPIDFTGAEINAEIRLTEIEFNHWVSFFGASIYAVVEMRKCIFRQGLDARYARFKGAPISFFKSTFESGVDISYSESDQGVGFEGVTFKGNLTGDGTAETINLSTATVSGNTSFRHSKGLLVLNGATLNGLFDLSDADMIALHGERLILPAASRLGPCSIGNVILTRATFGTRIHMDLVANTVDLSGAILSEGGLIELDKAEVNLRQLNLGSPLRVSGKLPGSAMPEVVGLLNADAGKVSLARVNLSRCSLYGAHGLGTLDIESTVGFPRCPWWAARRHYLADEWAWRAGNPSKLRPFRWRLSGVRIGDENERLRPGDQPAVWLPTLRASQIAGTYRDLRRSLESKSDMPGASDFYYGEMEMRRLDSESSFWDRLLVSIYWLLSGYGLRSARSIVAYIILISLAAWSMKFGGFPDGCYSPIRAVIFSLRSSLPGFSTVEQLSRSGQLVEIVTRVLGTLIVALFLLSLRTRVMRKPGE